jgi:hypothetical protein
MILDRRSSLVCFFSLVGSLAIAYGFSEPFQKRRATQHRLKSLGAFAVAFDANGSVTSARFRHLISPGFSEACAELQVVDLKGVVGIRQSLQELNLAALLGWHQGPGYSRIGNCTAYWVHRCLAIQLGGS